ncbi:aldehyde dehydrogenase family protein [Rhodococcus sp. NPDC056960]|uniref:aldehyde dehydrogenase family protein n=1 Tax=Rhodococcus sp. NPDC056960 TaxID=3345982 RepID=UPI003633470F
MTTPTTSQNNTSTPTAVPDATIHVVSPVSGELTAEVAVTSSSDLDAAIANAALAQKEWMSLPPAVRSQKLWKWGELVDAHYEELAELDTSCTGKVLRESRNECLMASRNIRYWAGMADKIFGDQLADVPGRFSYTSREPLGVFGVILPWNGPTHSFIARCVPPLACGNAVVVKPSELSPLSAIRLVELAVAAGLPSGLLSAAIGNGAVGTELVGHERVRGVSFTGSVATGRKVAELAAATFKPVTLELGGKSPVLVFDDADVEQAARAVLMTIYSNAGQICAAGSRLLVQSTIADTFVARLTELTHQLKVGDPRDESTHIGPVSCRRQYDRVMSLLEAARKEGAQIAVGGGRPEGVDKGCFVAPTILTRVTPDMTVSKEEIFGPVLTVAEFEDETDAVTQANDNEYGLAAYVWTTDMGRMHRVTAHLDAGAVHGNTPLVMDASLPFGGFKHSGVGNAYGADAIAGCTQTKRVTLRTTTEPLPNPWSFQ